MDRNRFSGKSDRCPRWNRTTASIFVCNSSGKTFPGPIGKFTRDREGSARRSVHMSANPGAFDRLQDDMGPGMGINQREIKTVLNAFLCLLVNASRNLLHILPIPCPLLLDSPYNFEVKEIFHSSTLIGRLGFVATL